MNEKIDVLVIGGGAAGMMAAGTAAERGLRVAVVEKNRMFGKKLLITGKGRCNVTNACEDVEDLISAVTVNRSFLYSAFYSFTNRDTMDFFEGLGVRLKTERGERVFPVSDKSSDIRDALVSYMKKGAVRNIRGEVKRILCENGAVCGAELENGEKISARAVVVATGGMSYRGTGSTGDGFRWARELGHTVSEPIASLVPLSVREEWAYALQGLSLRNVAVTVFNEKGKKVYSDFGEMMFAHFGITGPVILSASAHMRPMADGKYRVAVDLKPALDENALDKRILRDFSRYINKDFRNALSDLLPAMLIDTVCNLAKIDPRKKVNSVTREERAALVGVMKGLEMTVTDFCLIEQAIVTSGGVSVKELDPSTMQSKKVSGLFFAGEVIDVDAYTGGYNLQIAFSTGRLAGLNV